MKIQFSLVAATLLICCYSGSEVAGQMPGNEGKTNGSAASSSLVSIAISPAKQDEFNWRGKVSAGGVVEIFGVKGDIEAEASVGNEVEVAALKQGDQGEFHQVAVRVEESEGRVKICAAYPNLEGDGISQCLESLEWRSSQWNDGRELRLRYRNGNRQSVRLVDVQVRFKVRIPVGVHFIARTLSGDITASFGTADISSPIDLVTLGGNVSLEAPKSFNAHVRLAGGEIETEFPITVVGRFPGNGLEGNIGQGGPKISLSAGSGDAVLRRANDRANSESKDFTGRWETSYGIMTLEQVGDSVSGYYIMKHLYCSIEGKVKDRRFKFKFREPKSAGEGWFDLNSRGDRVSGMWRDYNESTWQPWKGRRNPALTTPIPGFDIRFTSGKSALAIPFELDTNHIFLPISVNGSPQRSFVLDTGGSSPYPKLSLRNAESFRMKLRPLGVKNGGVGTEFPDVYLVSDTTSFSLPGVVLSSRWMLAISTDKVNECFNRVTNGGGEKRVLDGIIGMGFFSSFVVEIDYDARLINLYDPLSYTYMGKGKSFPLEIEPESGLVLVRAQVKALGRRPVMARLVVDTGASPALTLNKQFAEAHELLPPAEKLTATNECGIGGVAEGRSFEGTLEALQLGDIKLSNPLTFFRHKPVGQGYDGLLGGGALRNFKVIFDYSRSRMILEPPR